MEWWAHALWQRHGLRMEDFCNMTRAQRLFYIASEIRAGEERQDTSPAGS